MASKQVADIIRKKQRNLKRLKAEEKWNRKFMQQLHASGSAGIEIEVFVHPDVDPKAIERMLEISNDVSAGGMTKFLELRKGPPETESGITGYYKDTATGEQRDICGLDALHLMNLL